MLGQDGATVIPLLDFVHHSSHKSNLKEPLRWREGKKLGARAEISGVVTCEHGLPVCVSHNPCGDNCKVSLETNFKNPK